MMGFMDQDGGKYFVAQRQAELWPGGEIEMGNGDHPAISSSALLGIFYSRDGWVS